MVKNSSPFFSKLVRVRASNLFTLLIGIIKPYHYYYWYFLLRSLVGEIFAGPFHQAKVVSSSFTVASYLRSVIDQLLLEVPRLKFETQYREIAFFEDSADNITFVLFA